MNDKGVIYVTSYPFERPVGSPVGMDAEGGASVITVEEHDAVLDHSTVT